MPAASFSPPADIDAATLAEKLKDGRTVLIDVREPEEFEDARIPGAVLIPMSVFDPRLVVAQYGDRDIVFQCLSGARSATAADAVAALGHRRPPSLIGGIKDWAAAGLPVTSGPF